MATASPFSDRPVWLAWAGMETDLIFNEGYDLPEFAAFPMIDSGEGRDRLHHYYERLIGLGRETGVGVILDTPTWMANPDRAAAVGYAEDELERVTRQSVGLVSKVAERHPGAAIRVSVCLGPRGDGYEAGIATAVTSEAYHGPQIRTAKEAGAQLVSAYTLGSVGEAIGISKAADRADIPAMVSFTIETDGKLADGTPLAQAVTELAAAAKPAAILVNCAHPDHIARAFDGGAWEADLAGVVANASRKSHAELDEAEELDDGDPEEFGEQLAALKASHDGIRVLGGCCGTDLRHLRETAERVGNAA